MPMPGPKTPSAASPAPMCSMSRLPPTPRAACPGSLGPSGRRRSRRVQWAGWSWRPSPSMASIASSATWPFLVAVLLDRERDEHERQDAEDQRLDRVEHAVEQEQRDREDRDGQRRDDAEGDLAAVDVAEESHRQRHGLDELEHELDEADEHGDDAGADAVLELVDREELAEVAPHAEVAEALDLEDQEADQGHADRDVHVARRRPQELDLADRRHEADPVVEQDEQEGADEDRDVGPRGRPGEPDPEVVQELVGPLEEVLRPARDELRAAASWQPRRR